MDEKNTVALLKERLNKDSKDIEAALALANQFYDTGDASQAIIYYRHALDINPALPGALTDLGTMYWRNDDTGLAEQTFRKAIALDSGFGNAYINLGLFLQHAKGNIAEARAVWQQLLNAAPGHAAAGKARELLQETAGSTH